MVSPGMRQTGDTIAGFARMTMDDSTDFEMQTRQRMLAMLELLEADKSSLSSAASDEARSGVEVYEKFIQEVRGALDCLDNKPDSRDPL